MYKVFWREPEGNFLTKKGSLGKPLKRRRKMPKILKKHEHIDNLRKYSSLEVLKAIRNIDRIPVPASEADNKKKKLVSNLELIKDIYGAEKEMDSAGTVGLTVSLKQLKVSKLPEPIWERMGTVRGEVYVVGSIMDGSGRLSDFKTQLFRGIRENSFLPLGTGGMLVGTIIAPRWFVDIHMVVMESDSEYRRMGEIMEKAREDSQLDKILDYAGSLSLFDPTNITKVVTGVKLFYDLLTSYLVNNGDDYLGTIHDFYLKHQAFGQGEFPLKKYGDIEAAYSIELTEI